MAVGLEAKWGSCFSMKNTMFLSFMFNLKFLCKPGGQYTDVMCYDFGELFSFELLSESFCLGVPVVLEVYADTRAPSSDSHTRVVCHSLSFCWLDSRAGGSLQRSGFSFTKPLEFWHTRKSFSMS